MCYVYVHMPISMWTVLRTALGTGDRAQQQQTGAADWVGLFGTHQRCNRRELHRSVDQQLEQALRLPLHLPHLLESVVPKNGVHEACIAVFSRGHGISCGSKTLSVCSIREVRDTELPSELCAAWVFPRGCSSSLELSALKEKRPTQ